MATYAITATLFAGLQVILPGEAAPSHHHTPAALRLVVEGHGAYTTVEGVKCAMEPGDLIITPPMRWHDHGHEGTEPVVWLDGLDIPLVRSLEAAWASKMRPAGVPATASDPSEDEFTAAGLVPRRSRYPATGFPQVRWPWRTVRAALARLAAGAAADAPVTLRYVDPTTGAPPLPTMGAEAQWLRPGERTRADRTTASRVYHVIEGHGQSRVGETTLAWAPGDTFVAPPWHFADHANQRRRPGLPVPVQRRAGSARARAAAGRGALSPTLADGRPPFLSSALTIDSRHADRYFLLARRRTRGRGEGRARFRHG